MSEHEEGGMERPGETEVRRLLETAGGRPEVPREDLDAVLAAARYTWEVRWTGEAAPEAARSARRRWAAAAALAAAVIVALGLAWWWRGTGGGGGGAPPVVARVERVTGPFQLVGRGGEPRDLAAGEDLPAGSEVRTGGAGLEPRGRASLRLANGAVLRVDAESTVRLVAARVVDLERGAVYADTGAGGGEGATLEVRTPLATARDVGTRFAVLVVGGEPGSVRVLVRDGAVEVERGGARYRAGAGDELVVRGDGSVERREVSPHGRYWEWVLAAAPPFELEGRTLQELLDWVARETGWRILFEDEALAASASEIVLHGSIEELRADQAAFAVLPGAGLEGELRGGVLLVRRAPEDFGAPPS